MSHLGSIHTYRSEVDQIIRYGGSSKETSLRRAVFTLINAYARPRDLLPVEELDYKEAVEGFKQDIPNIVHTLRGMIQQQGKANTPFRVRRDTFIDLCRSAINPAVTPDDVDEMLILHILTEEIFRFPRVAACNQKLSTMSYPSIDALQRVLVESVFHYAQDRKKAAGRALGTLVEIITYYALKGWGFRENVAIERPLPEFGNPGITHNVEFSLHPIYPPAGDPSPDLHAAADHGEAAPRPG